MADTNLYNSKKCLGLDKKMLIALQKGWTGWLTYTAEICGSANK